MYKIYTINNYFFLLFVNTNVIYDGYKEDFQFQNPRANQFDVIYKGSKIIDGAIFSNFVDSTDAEFTSNETLIDFYSLNTGFNTASGGSEAVSGKWGMIEIPEDFDHPLAPFNIIRSVEGTAKLLNINSDNYRKKLSAPTIKYVDQILGNDANTGDSWAQAYKTFTQLRTVAFDRAFVAKGNYAYTGSIPFTTEKEVISVGGKSNFCRGILGTDVVWTSVGSGTFSNVLSAAITLVVDTSVLDENGLPLRLTKLTSLVDVQATPVSWYKDTGTNTLYVHYADGLTPSRNSAMMAIAASGNTNGHNNYIENFTFIGGASFNNNSATPTTTVYKNCDFIFNTTTNGFSALGNGIVFMENCKSCFNFLDGFNYHKSGVYNVSAIEIGCVGFGNGENNTTSINNGSTAHDNCRVLRIGGIYFDNEGPNVHDVNDSKSLNIDCVAYNSLAVDEDNKTDFALGAAEDEACKIWLDGCFTRNELTTFGAEDRSGLGNIFVRNSFIKNIEGGTYLTTY